MAIVGSLFRGLRERKQSFRIQYPEEDYHAALALKPPREA